VVTGHVAYYAVPGNTDAVAAFRAQISRLWFNALRRRSPRKRLNWTPMGPLTTRWLPPARVRHPFPNVRFDGGSSFTFIELGIALEEMGRTLVVSPFFSSCVMTPELLLAIDDVEANGDYPPGLASGELIGTVALAEDSGSWQVADVATEATEAPVGWTLSVRKPFVLDGAVAGLMLVAARSGERVDVFAVDATAEGLTRAPLHTMDQTRKQAPH
jgi:hypothetical protein